MLVYFTCLQNSKISFKEISLCIQKKKKIIMKNYHYIRVVVYDDLVEAVDRNTLARLILTNTCT